MSNPYNRFSIDASYHVSVHLAEGFQRRRLKCETLTNDGRRKPSDGKRWAKNKNVRETRRQSRVDACKYNLLCSVCKYKLHCSVCKCNLLCFVCKCELLCSVCKCNLLCSVCKCELLCSVCKCSLLCSNCKCSLLCLWM